MARSSLSTTATKAILCALGLVAAPAFADPMVRIETETYEVSATTLDGLKAQMREHGPDGFWAQTRWHIKWSNDCAVNLDITFTLPKHSNPDAMPADTRRIWGAMRSALNAHEKQHAAHGMRAAEEISEARCSQAKAIIRKYNRADLRLDRRTEHGRTQGVRLD